MRGGKIKHRKVTRLVECVVFGHDRPEYEYLPGSFYGKCRRCGRDKGLMRVRQR